ncbi:hypothetical protein [Singulisphaera sp. PoT]|uniref:hypothetical protein n=1 Tax=Singulisphaera sp. PoT TaxID=3411797 RepID=UPI003BF57B37
MSQTNGPSVRIVLSCFNCKHETSESYRVQGDSGSDVYCTHPQCGGKKRVGDTRWDTPDWCPLRDDAIRDHLMAGSLYQVLMKWKAENGS